MRILVRLVAHRVARCVWRVVFVFVFKQKTAYEMRISDWSSDVCSSDLTYSAESRRSASGPTLISIMFSIKAHRQGGQSLVSPHDIVSSGLCIGCGGCVAGANRSATKMRWDRYGPMTPSGPLQWLIRRESSRKRVGRTRNT